MRYPELSLIIGIMAISGSMAAPIPRSGSADTAVRSESLPVRSLSIESNPFASKNTEPIHFFRRGETSLDAQEKDIVTARFRCEYLSQLPPANSQTFTRLLVRFKPFTVLNSKKLWLIFRITKDTGIPKVAKYVDLVNKMEYKMIRFTRLMEAVADSDLDPEALWALWTYLVKAYPDSKVSDEVKDEAVKVDLDAACASVRRFSTPTLPAYTEANDLRPISVAGMNSRRRYMIFKELVSRFDSLQDVRNNVARVAAEYIAQHRDADGSLNLDGGSSLTLPDQFASVLTSSPRSEGLKLSSGVELSGSTELTKEQAEKYNLAGFGSSSSSSSSPVISYPISLKGTSGRSNSLGSAESLAPFGAKAVNSNGYVVEGTTITPYSAEGKDQHLQILKDSMEMAKSPLTKSPLTKSPLPKSPLSQSSGPSSPVKDGANPY